MRCACKIDSVMTSSFLDIISSGSIFQKYARS